MEKTGAMLDDLSNLITWAHSHSTICLHKPLPEGVFNLGPPGHQYIVTWQCEAGHAYNWPFTHATEVNVKTEEDRCQKLKRRRTQPQSSDEEEEMQKETDDALFGGKIGDEDREDSNVHHCSVVTHVSDELRKQKEDMTGNNVRNHKQSALTQPPGMMICEDPDVDICMDTKKRKVWLEHKNKESNQAEEESIEKRKVLEEGSLSPNNNLTSAVDDALFETYTISDTESATEDEEWLTPKGRQGCSSPHRPMVHSQSYFSALLSPPAPQSPGPSTGHSSSEKAKVKTVPTKPTEKRGPKKAEAKLGNLETFYAWLSAQNPSKVPCPASLQIAELDSQMTAYFKYIREESHQHSWTYTALMSYARALDRDLQSRGYSFSLLKSSELVNARNELNACGEDLKQRGSNRDIEVIQSLRQEEEAALRQMGVLSRASPEGLFNLVLLNNIQAFGKIHIQAKWPVCFSDFQLFNKTHAGTGNGVKLEYLEWNHPNDSEQGPLRMHSLPNDPERCPLRDYKLYSSKRNGGFLNSHNGFYCSHRIQSEPWRKDWYNRTPLTKPRLEKLIKTLSHHIIVIRNRKAEVHS